MSGPQGSGSQDAFSMRLAVIDYHMATPLPTVDYGYSRFQGESIDKVPVIRVFGATPAGQKVCMHVHKVCAGVLLVR